MFNFKAKREKAKPKGSILIIDNIKPWDNFLVKVLTGMNYRVESAGSYEDAKNLLINNSFDVAIVEPRLDIDDPSNLDGLRLIALIYSTRQSKNTIIYTGFPTHELIREMGDYKVLDFVDKREHPEYIVAAIEKALSAPPTWSNFPHLTIPEQEVLELLAKGKSDHEIAKEIHERSDVVRNHVSNILAKLYTNNRDKAAMIAKYDHLIAFKNGDPSPPNAAAISATLPKTSDSVNAEELASTDQYLNQKEFDGLSRNPKANEKEIDLSSVTKEENKRKGTQDIISRAPIEVQRSLHVFLCHAHSDAVAVRGLYNRLRKNGVDAWLDKEKLLAGADWELEIRKTLQSTDVIIVCLSKNFDQRGFRQKEVRLALEVAMEQPEGEIFIIPVRLEECKGMESLKKWHWVNLFEQDGYKKLIQALKARAKNVGASLK